MGNEHRLSLWGLPATADFLRAIIAAVGSDWVTAERRRSVSRISAWQFEAETCSRHGWAGAVVSVPFFVGCNDLLADLSSKLVALFRGGGAGLAHRVTVLVLHACEAAAATGKRFPSQQKPHCEADNRNAEAEHAQDQRQPLG